MTVIDTLAVYEDGVSFEVEVSPASMRMAPDATSGTLSLTAKAWKKIGEDAKTAYTCFFAMYTRTGTTYSRVAYSSSKAISWSPGAKTIAATVDEVVVIIADSVMSASGYASGLPAAFLASASVSMSADGKTGDPAVHYDIDCQDTIKPGDDYIPVYIIRSEGKSIARRDLAAALSSWNVELNVSGLSGAIVENNESQVSVVGSTITSSTVLTLTLKEGSNVVATKKLRGVTDGVSITGKTGKMCYIVGEYSSEITYTSNDSQTVAVEIAGSGNTVELYLLKAATNVVGGVHYPPLDANGNINSAYWEKGLNTYNLIRTKYLFADFANLGSFVVSGDWLFSQKGGEISICNNTGISSYSSSSMTYLRTVTAKSPGSHTFKITASRSSGSMYIDIVDIDTESTMYSRTFGSNTTVATTLSLTAGHSYAVWAYKSASGVTATATITMSTPCDYLWFVGSDPLGTEVLHFAPNYAVDGMTGKSYQSDAYVKGLIYASGGEITGDMKISGTLTVGSTSGTRLVIDPSDTAIIGYNSTTELYRLSSKTFTTLSHMTGTTTQTTNGYLNFGNSYFCKDELALISISGSVRKGAVVSPGEFLAYYVNGTTKRSFMIQASTTFWIGSGDVNTDIWPKTKSEVPVGCVWLDGETLKVRTS